MGRFFSTAGPIQKENHYNIEPLTRMNLDEIRSLVDQQKYFVLHAPRQTGKTSYLLALMDYFNQEGKYKCLYMNVEMAQAARENVKEGIRTILDILANNAENYLGDTFLKDQWIDIFEKSGEFSAFQNTLNLWARHNQKPLILFIDEIDTLVGDTLISVLRQLRSGYTVRPGMFPQSIILCGVRDVRDYRIHSDIEKTVITGGSAFNIKAKSLRLGNFNPDEIKMLYEQHTKETGQKFSKDVFPLVWELTEGQPWLVNALGYETCFELEEGKDRDKEITVDIINLAKENLILRRETHLDQLADKLREERVRRVIEPILSSMEAEKIPVDDVDYVLELGLVKKDPYLKIANRIYREVIPRQLIYSTQMTISDETRWYLHQDGSLNMDKLLTAFREFFKKHFESWVKGFDYEEAGPQLLLQAFLQRIVNAGGQVEREYGLGRQRTDLLVIWPYKNGIQQIILELKIRYGTTEKTIKQGLIQTKAYMDKCGADEGYLIIFDRRKRISWKEKSFKKNKTIDGMNIKIYGM